MTTAVLHKYIDTGARCFANIAFSPQDRVLLSVVPAGMAIFRLHLWGRIPGRRLFGADAHATARIHRVLARGVERLPPLPLARDAHRDEGAMASLLDAALIDLKAAGEGRAIPGAVEALDLDAASGRPLAVFTRFALTAADREECARLFARAGNTRG